MSVNLICDGTQLLMANLAVNDDDYTNDNDYLGGVTGILRQLAGFINMFQPRSMFVTFDIDKSKYRLELYPEYKAGRIDKTSPELAAKFKHRALHTSYLKELLPLLGVNVLTYPEVEADDIISNFVHQSKRNNILISTDKDFIQLVCNNTRLYRPIRESIMISTDNIQDVLGYNPELYLKCRVLEGDKSDNIKGVAGVATKTALKIFDLVGSSDPHDICKWAETECKFKYKDDLVNFIKEGRWELNHKLMDLKLGPKIDVGSLIKPIERNYQAAYDFLIDLKVDDYIYEDDIHQILTIYDSLK